jgi:hypothetical protein
MAIPCCSLLVLAYLTRCASSLVMPPLRRRDPIDASTVHKYLSKRRPSGKSFLMDSKDGELLSEEVAAEEAILNKFSGVVKAGMTTDPSPSFTGEEEFESPVNSLPLLSSFENNVSDEVPSSEIDNNEVEDINPLMAPICRIVTRAGSRLPTEQTKLPQSMYRSPYILDKLDAYYHAKARRIIQEVSPYPFNIFPHTSRWLQDPAQISDGSPSKYSNQPLRSELDITVGDSKRHNSTEQRLKEDSKTISVLRQSLEDSGFELLSRRDIDLCDALNAGYLLRLSILPDVSALDPTLFRQFFPERFHTNGTFIQGGTIDIDCIPSDGLDIADDVDDVLFDGRVLVYWRGYSQEVTKGRLFLPKIDYLQASLVQRSAAWVKKEVDKLEVQLFRGFVLQSRKLRRSIRYLVYRFVDLLVGVWKSIAKQNIENGDKLEDVQDISDEFGNLDDETVESVLNDTTKLSGGRFKLGRYGGSNIRFVGSPNPNDALAAFTICEVKYDDPSPVPNKYEKYQSRDSDVDTKNGTESTIEHDMYDKVNHHTYKCNYDEKMNSGPKSRKELPRMQLLERVSLGNVVDVFTRASSRKLLTALFSTSELVEPTFEEVIVIWRPLVKQEKNISPPSFVTEFADMFDIEGFDQNKAEKAEVPLGKLEIRLFEQVPMSNLLAVLPKTKLIFRPADALLFDTISFGTFALVLSSIKLDSPKLDFLALLSVALWIFRTVFRYSNKLARYDLLVKTFLTSKISQRNSGALKYLSYEAGSQRAIRAAVAHSWVLHEYKMLNSPFERETGNQMSLSRYQLEQECVTGINRLLNTKQEVQLDPIKAIQDLEDLKLIRFSDDQETVLDVRDPFTGAEMVKQLWIELLEREGQLDFKDDFIVGKATGNSTNGIAMEDIEDAANYTTTVTEQSTTTPLNRPLAWQKRRKAIVSVLNETGRVGISKAIELFRDREFPGQHRTLRSLREFFEKSNFKQ